MQIKTIITAGVAAEMNASGVITNFIGEKRMKMKRYYIYDMKTDKYLGSVVDTSIEFAELQYIRDNNVGSLDIYALSTAPGEPLA